MYTTTSAKFRTHAKRYAATTSSENQRLLVLGSCSATARPTRPVASGNAAKTARSPTTRSKALRGWISEVVTAMATAGAGPKSSAARTNSGRLPTSAVPVRVRIFTRSAAQPRTRSSASTAGSRQSCARESSTATALAPSARTAARGGASRETRICRAIGAEGRGLSPRRPPAARAGPRFDHASGAGSCSRPAAPNLGTACSVLNTAWTHVRYSWRGKPAFMFATHTERRRGQGGFANGSSHWLITTRTKGRSSVDRCTRPALAPGAVRSGTGPRPGRISDMRPAAPTSGGRAHMPIRHRTRCSPRSASPPSAAWRRRTR
jgi:hypothetical protein